MNPALEATAAATTDQKVLAEQTIIGLQLRDGRGAVAAVRELASALIDLFEAPHDRIQRAIFDLESEGQSASPATVALRLADDPGLREIGGRNYLNNLAMAAPAAISAADTGSQLTNMIADWCAIAQPAAMKSYLDGRRLDSAELRSAADIAAQFEPARTLQTICAADWDGCEIPARRELVEGLIPRNSVTLLAGDGGTGKSLLALQLAASVCLQTNWLGRAVFETGPVLFLSAEDTRDELHYRLGNVLEHQQAGMDRLRNLHMMSFAGDDAMLAISDTRNTIRPTPLFASIERRVRELRPVLIVFDPLADFFGGDENNRTQARQFISLLRGLGLRHHTTPLLLAHPSLSGLSSGSGTSGSTGWSNSVRSRLYFERMKSPGDVEDDPDARILRCKKFNYGPSGGEIRLRWQHGVFTHRPDECGAAAVSIVQAKADRVFLEMLAAYAAEGRDVGASTGHRFAPHVFASDKRSDGVTKRALADAMNRLFEQGRVHTEETGPPSKRHKRIVLAALGGQP